MYSLHLSPEQIEIRDTVRDFVEREVKPFALRPARMEALDRSLPATLLAKASQLGLRTLALSEDHGGAGADTLTSCIVAEELAAGDPDVAAVLGETSALAHALFDRAMNAEQRARLLPAFLEDDAFHIAPAHRDPEQDDALGINYHRPVSMEADVRTKAVRSHKGELVINGRKACVANAPVAKLFAVTVATGADVGTVLVPRECAGVAVSDHAEADRWFHGACGDVTFQDCRVPAENLLTPGGPGDGESPHDDGQRDRAAVLAAAVNLGIGRAAYEAALDYAGLRIQGGRRIVEHQAIGTKLAEIAMRLTVARNAVWQAAWACDHPDAFADRSLADAPLATMARVFTAEAVHRAAKDAAECFGAMGVMRDLPLQKYVRDALVSLHGGHGPGDAKLRIAEALVGYRRFPAATVRAAE